MKKWSTIGAKLVLAFTGTTVLMTVVSVVAWLTWGRLDGQVSELLENAVPKYNTSYLLESRSSEIRHRVQLLPTLTNRVEIDSLALELAEQLSEVKSILAEGQLDPIKGGESAILSELYFELEQSLSHYSNLVLLRVEQTRQLNKLKEQINQCNS